MINYRPCTATVAKFRKGESVSLTTINRICRTYGINLEQVVEIKYETESPESD